MHALWATALAVPLFVASGAALAGEPGSDDDVVVTGKRDGYGAADTAAAKTVAPLRDLPQSIAVIPAAVLRDQRALSLQDALKNVPGIGFAAGDGQRDQVTIRGFSAIADQYVNGFRDDALYFRDLSNTERVEVIKGPAAVLYGRGSSGGLINRVLKRPDVDVTSATLTSGSFGRARAEWDLGRYAAASGVGMRLTGAYEDSGSFREQQFLRRVALAPSLLVQGGSTSLYAVADYVRDRRLMDLGIPALDGRPVDVPPGTYYGAANARDADTTESQVLSQTVVVEHALTDGLRFRDGFRHYDYALERHSTLPDSVDAKALTVTLRHGRLDRQEEGWSNQAELTQTLALAGTRHQLLYGYEAARQLKDATTYAQRVVARTALFDPVLPVVDDRSFTALSARTSTTLETQALYLQDLADLGHGVKALVGARHDWFSQRTRQLLPGQPNLARLDRTWSPRAGLVLQPDTAQSYYVSWSRSYQPSAETFALAANNAELAPERTVNREVGAKYTLFGGRLALQAAGFVLRRTGIKGTDPAAPTKLIPIGTQRTRGIELSGQLDLAAGLHAIAGYSYLDARVTASANPAFADKRATITPRDAANLFVTEDVADRFGVGGGLNYVGDRWADPANTTVLPHYVTADAMAWWRIGAARLQLNGYNLGDRHYIVAGHGTSPLLNLPGAPRTVLVTLRLDG
ncbi:TonB-dependent siderophore receptor [Sphingomonas yunnanensis]|uniref:TonB-dependent receptor n=1 Tax=Sphingomonas yunnanensis TaxID=310400 RepID=UPI001CA747AA|nr:TonB-dependent siderophore receptor [Sphingomonas yunnanensis]MBY9062950.1 TonB-dependent siderophore receptor [Sphingomonas yunnanensis]